MVGSAVAVTVSDSVDTNMAKSRPANTAATPRLRSGLGSAAGTSPCLAEAAASSRARSAAAASCASRTAAAGTPSVVGEAGGGTVEGRAGPLASAALAVRRVSAASRTRASSAAVPPVRSTPSIAAPSRPQNLEPQVCSPVRSRADLRTQRTPTRQQCATRPFAEDLARSSMGSSRYRPSRVTVLTAVKLIELAREGYAVGELGKHYRLLRHATRRGLQALEIASQWSERCNFKLENDR